MLGDTAIAVNPKDERYKHLWDKTVTLPIVGRELKVIRDDLADPEFGTGVVKVTPATIRMTSPRASDTTSSSSRSLTRTLA